MDKHKTGLCNVRLMLSMILIVTFLWSVSQAYGEIYKWQDEDGNWHFTDSPTSDRLPKNTEIKNQPSHAPQPDKKSIRKAEDQSPSKTGQAVKPPAGGLLWRLIKADQAPSYLLGTIHSSDARVTRLKPNVIKALDNSDRFVMEMVLDTNAFMHFGASMLLPEGEDLESTVGSTLFAKVVTAMSDLGMPESLVRRMKPWVVISMLGMPKSNGELILDMVLYQRATGQGKPTTGLETAKEQLDVFEGLSKADQISLLKTTIEKLPSQPQIFEELIKAYLSDDLDEIQNLAKRFNHGNASAAIKRFMVRLNDERNQRMVQRIIPYTMQGNSFIAVGALHLGGPNGILALLNKRGYKTEPIR